MAAIERRRWRRTPRPRRAAAARTLPGRRARHAATCSSSIVNDRPGVLNRVASLDARPQLQHRVAGGRPHRAAGFSRMTITPPRRRLRGRADGQAALPADRRAQGPGRARPSVVEHELALIKVRATERNRGRAPASIIELVQGPRPRRRAREPVIVESRGTEQEIDSLRRAPCAASASGSWSGPVPSPWPAARAPSTSKGSSERDRCPPSQSPPPRRQPQEGEA